MYQRPEGLSNLIALQMRSEGYGHAAPRQAGREKEEADLLILYLFIYFTISVAFLKGYMQGHVTFWCLNKKKEFILLQNVPFFLFFLCGHLRLF